MVYDLCYYEHIVQIYIECSSQTDYSHDRTVCICFNMVSIVGVSVGGLPLAEEQCSSSQEWHTLPVSRCYCNSLALGNFSIGWTHTQLNGYFSDTSITGSHHQGSLAPFYRFSISSVLSHSICQSHLFISCSVDPRCHARLFYWVFDKFLWHPLRITSGVGIRLSKYLF